MQHADNQSWTPAQVIAEDWGWRHATRKDFVLQHVNFTVQPGEHVLFLGASGAGKSTLMAGMAGVLGGEEEGKAEGKLTVGGIPAHEARGNVGLVMQDPDSQIILERLGDDVAFGSENLGVDPKTTWQRVDASLKAVGLHDLIHTKEGLRRSTQALSGGQRQRLALAGVLAMQPGLLLLDEPTANLDPQGVAEVHDAVANVLNETGATMVVVEHHIDVWMDLIDRVIVIGRPAKDSHAYDTTIKDSCSGCIIADGKPDEVFAQYGDMLACGGAWVPGRKIRSFAPKSSRRVQITDQGKPEQDETETSRMADRIALYTDDCAFGRLTPLAEHVNIGFRFGEVSALMGANGAGKTTFALTLAGLLPTLCGSVRLASSLVVQGRDNNIATWKSRELLGRVGMVFQEPEHQFITSSVREEVALAPKTMGKSLEESYEIADSMLKRMNLTRFAPANPYTLSGGEKRRLSVASLLAAAPRVVIMDEPTFGQDFTTWSAMVELIAAIRDNGSSVIIVTHDQALVDALDARVIMVNPATRA